MSELYDGEIKEVLDSIKLLDKLYEKVRFVDPVLKKVVNYKDNAINEIEGGCFELWGKSKVCDNCISMRAYNENETFVKIEYSPDNIYMITAVPVELSNRRIVIELMKNITNSMVFGTRDHENTSKIHSIIDSINNLALKDALTGVYNRRFINEKLPIEIINAALSDKRISIIMADIDFFKNVNDTYGHVVGDCVIKGFASILSRCLKRDSDWVSRYGGEEFLICLPGCGLESAAELAEDMRKIVEAEEIICGDKSIKITSSFGVHCLRPTQTNNLEAMLEAADKMLYKAKRNGRNRVEWQ